MNDIDPSADALEVNEKALGGLKKLGQQVLDLRSEIESLEAQATDRQKELNELLLRKLPELMIEAGALRLDLLSGHVIELKDLVTGGLPKEPEKRKALLDLLRKRGHGDIIKGELSVLVDKGKDNVAQEAAAALEKLGFAPEFTTTVHHQTYMAWARERYTDEKDRDWLVESADQLGLFIAKQATIKEPKAPKKRK